MNDFGSHACAGRFTWCFLVWSLAAPAIAEMKVEPARVAEIAAWLPARPAGFGRPITDRAAWERLAKAPGFAAVVREAESLAKGPAPALPDELFLDFSKTGNRDRGQKVLGARTSRLATLTLAECLENQGHFLKPLAETITALCAERTWVYPAHDGRLDNFYGRTVEMDLRATFVGWELASVDYLLGEKLPGETRRLLKENVERRVLAPFKDMAEGRRKEIHWMRATHNWNAVCLAGVTGAALALEESPAERAWFVAAAERYIAYFLKSFTPDGYCSEGVGYWNYGFGHFLMLGEAVRQATGGHLDLLAQPEALQPALFCRRAEILNGIFPTISDVHPGARPDAQFVSLINQRFRLAGARAADFVRPVGGLAGTLMFSFLPSPLPGISHAEIPSDSPLRTWFKDGGVLLCRTAPGAGAAFGAALKGGHNAENHNHNDVGSFSVIVGSAMVICDPGAETYTARTFSARRYDSKVLSSYGHAVPRIAGQLQQTGAAARAAVLRTDFTDQADTLALDIRSAYNVPELQQLDRTFVFRRGTEPSLEVRDEVAFSEPKTFETALITWGEWKQVSERELLFTDGPSAVRVRIDTGGEPFGVSAETLNEDVVTPRKPVRLGIALKGAVKHVTVVLTLAPAS